MHGWSARKSTARGGLRKPTRSPKGNQPVVRERAREKEKVMGRGERKIRPTHLNSNILRSQGSHNCAERLFNVLVVAKIKPLNRALVLSLMRGSIQSTPAYLRLHLPTDFSVECLCTSFVESSPIRDIFHREISTN